jgi:hypothetical protein
MEQSFTINTLGKRDKFLEFSGAPRSERATMLGDAYLTTKRGKVSASSQSRHTLPFFIGWTCAVRTSIALFFLYVGPCCPVSKIDSMSALPKSHPHDKFKTRGLGVNTEKEPSFHRFSGMLPATEEDDPFEDLPELLNGGSNAPRENTYALSSRSPRWLSPIDPWTEGLERFPLRKPASKTCFDILPEILLQ